MRDKIVITGGSGAIAQSIAEIVKAIKGCLCLTPSRNELDVTDPINACSYMACFKPSILINNAGCIVPNPIHLCADDEWQKHIAVNLSGAFYCSKYAILAGCRTIINIGSTSAFQGRPEWGAYCATKAGILSLTETLAEEGINAYSLNPARTKTKMREGLFPNEDQNTLMNPNRIGEFIIKILNGEFKSGSHIVVKKNEYYVLSSRQGV